MKPNPTTAFLVWIALPLFTWGFLFWIVARWFQ
jgi:hypothetical protein